MNNTPTLHAHVASETADCDGRMGGNTIIVLNEGEIAEFYEKDGVNDFHEFMFKERVLGSVVSFDADSVLKFTKDGFEYHEPTDEGYCAADVYWCEEEGCDPWMRTSYDKYAEAAGY